MEFEEFVNKTYGFATSEWLTARGWLTRRLRRVAAERQGSTIQYGTLCEEMRREGVLTLEPHGTPLAALLGQINVLEREEGRPLISAVVVSKDTGQPGVGFWNLAQEMGSDIGDTPERREAFWLDALAACHAYWSRHRSLI
jgi:hypothetical protein